MKATASILLNYENLFNDQQVEIYTPNDTIIQGADGTLSTAKHASTVLWVGGNENDMRDILHVKIFYVDGIILLDGNVNRNFRRPTNTGNGVLFYVF